MADSRSLFARDLASAYVASGARILSWVIVLGLVYRRLGADAFALLALLRATIGILNYASLGLGPAMIWRMSQAGPSGDAGPRPLPILLANGLVMSVGVAGLGAVIIWLYAASVGHAHRILPGQLGDARWLVITLGIGTILKLISDAPGAALQVSRRISLDYTLVALAEVVWVAVAAVLLLSPGASVVSAGQAFVWSGAFLLVARMIAANGGQLLRGLGGRWFDPAIARSLLAYGVLFSLSQLGDFLYAPVDYILINRLITPQAVATYAPAVQIDAAMLLLVSALAAVILPRSALAHAAGDHALGRRYYMRGTVASGAILAIVGAAVYFASPLIFRLWLEDSMEATQAILPLVLIHTVVGGSSAVGRAVLLGAGRVKAYTASVLVAGVANVILSYIFVAHLGLGLRGIILGTIVVVVARCAVWMPWYVLRALRDPRPVASHRP